MSTTKSKHRSEQTISGSWQLDAQRSSVEFRARSIWGLAAVKGHFADYQGHLDLTAAPAIELTIDAASLDTGNTQARRAPALRRLLRRREPPASAIRI